MRFPFKKVIIESNEEYVWDPGINDLKFGAIRSSHALSSIYNTCSLMLKLHKDGKKITTETIFESIPRKLEDRIKIEPELKELAEFAKENLIIKWTYHTY